MTQDAVVTKLLPNSMAEVAVTRMTACGSNCGNCESCIYQSEVKAQARNLIGAKPGQSVVIETKSSHIFKAAMLVYVLPLVMFIIAYAAAYLLGASEGVCIGASFAGLAVGAAMMVLSQRLKKKEEISFDIIEFRE